VTQYNWIVFKRWVFLGSFSHGTKLHIIRGSLWISATRSILFFKTPWIAGVSLSGAAPESRSGQWKAGRRPSELCLLQSLLIRMVMLHPRMPQRLRQGKSISRLPFEQAPDQFLQLTCRDCWELQLQLQYFGNQLAVVCALKWWSPYDHLIQQHTSTPHIQSVVVAMSLNHLRSEVIQCTAESCAQSFRNSAPPKVSYLQDIASID
jgi:hypothetical protein